MSNEHIFEKEWVAIPESKVWGGAARGVTERGSWRAGPCMNTNRDVQLFRKCKVRLKLRITRGKALVLSTDFSQKT